VSEGQDKTGTAPEKMSCAEFQAQLAELVGSGADASAHPHILSCENCRKLLSDLESIAEAARQLLPIEEPRDELWEQIKSAIQSDENGSDPKRKK
jgi:hypothetical protein